jgi:hypothetical protein
MQAIFDVGFEFGQCEFAHAGCVGIINREHPRQISGFNISYDWLKVAHGVALA